ncbi:hypothetical protein JCGZ_23693 [Jatropha curcas]|uniref:Uncharacterized protein n=1 Tax=Jatropha curcas TaxID=180498 RepID=A0A067L6D2_JATCU|nr:hypothetical protein JCGZ_23693 [Jatropha curcas]
MGWRAAAAAARAADAVAGGLVGLSFKSLFREVRTSEKYSGTSSAILVIFRTFQVPYWHTFGELFRTASGQAGLFAVRENRLFEPQNLSIHSA